MFTSSSGVFEEEKEDHSAQCSYRLNHIFYRSINCSHFAYGDDLMLLIPKTEQYYCRSFTSLQLLLNLDALSTSVMFSIAYCFEQNQSSHDSGGPHLQIWQGMQLLFPNKQRSASSSAGNDLPINRSKQGQGFLHCDRPAYLIE